MNKSWIALFFIFGSFLFGCKENNQKNDSQNKELELWYNQPAKDWMTEALPFGNGYIGDMFYGGHPTENIQFNEGSLWDGGPGSTPDYNFGIKKDAYKALPKIRELLRKGDREAADKLVAQKLTGVTHPIKGFDFGDYGAQQTMGNILITVDDNTPAREYKRKLDISDALAQVTYKTDHNQYTRTYFGNYPKNTMVYRLDSKEKANYTIELKIPHPIVSETFDKNTWILDGELKNNHMKFQTQLNFHIDQGSVEYSDHKIVLKDVKSVVIRHVASTEYANIYPTYRGNDFEAQNQKNMDLALASSYNKLLNEHKKDYHNLFDRVSLKLGVENGDTIPTDKRLVQYHKGGADAGLEELYFQYARYMIIQSSRPGTMPMHLQGKWNNSTMPPWACDYHLNINIQMIHWPMLLTNLSECNEPLVDWIEKLSVPGGKATKEFFGTRGWTAHTMVNAFGYCSPGWGLPWGFYPAGGAWLCQHMWQHYQFTGDKDYLAKNAYPVMKEAALFWFDYLTKDENGYWVSMPSYSPEHGGISTGAAMDHQIAWDLFNNCIEAGKIVNENQSFIDSLTSYRDHLCPPMIGKWGQLQEWKEDLDDPKDHHRHISHLYALHPGNQISIENTPKLAEAARVTLKGRGDVGTGWSLAWKVNFWARLHDGNHAYKMLRKVLRPVYSKGENMVNGGGTYSNLLCAHPPFQLDGNMGSCAGIAEMLLQSQNNKIEILPALPDSWKNGEIKGLCTRQHVDVDIQWQDGCVSKITLHSHITDNVTVEYGEKEIVLDLQKGASVSLNKDLVIL